jgi:hypothetical protein
MKATDYIFSAIFIALIVRQVHGRRLTAKGMLVPIAIVAIAANRYLHGIPTAGNDLALVVACIIIGLALGATSALATAVRPGPDGVPLAKAGPAAVILWILGTGSRLVFGLYATDGGAHTIAAVSKSLAITGQAWAPALILMAFAEVIARYGILAVRALALTGGLHALMANSQLANADARETRRPKP